MHPLAHNPSLQVWTSRASLIISLFSLLLHGEAIDVEYGPVSMECDNKKVVKCRVDTALVQAYMTIRTQPILVQAYMTI